MGKTAGRRRNRCGKSESESESDGSSRGIDGTRNGRPESELSGWLWARFNSSMSVRVPFTLPIP